VESNAWTLAHERYNAEWILEQGAGVVVSSFTKVADAVRELLRPARYIQYRAQAAAVRNSAVFEVPEILRRSFPASIAARTIRCCGKAASLPRRGRRTRRCK